MMTRDELAKLLKPIAWGESRHIRRPTEEFRQAGKISLDAEGSYLIYKHKTPMFGNFTAIFDRDWCVDDVGNFMTPESAREACFQHYLSKIATAFHLEGE